MRKLVIHCWGGLGSQLYAWAMAEMITRKFPRRKLQIVFHSSGVTKRYSDLMFLSSSFNIKFKDDFISDAESKLDSSNGHYSITRILTRFLKFIRIVLNCNTNEEFNRIKPWTLSLRGHYSYINLDPVIIEKMLSQIYIQFRRASFKSIKQDSSLSVHYRLGDLKQLKNKTYIESKILGNCIQKTVFIKKCKVVMLCSDDQSFAKQLLQNFLPSETTIVESDVWKTLFNLVEANYFIGTNSKISLWATIFRKAIDTHSWNSLPEQMKVAAEVNLKSFVDLKNNDYY